MLRVVSAFRGLPLARARQIGGIRHGLPARFRNVRTFTTHDTTGTSKGKKPTDKSIDKSQEAEAASTTGSGSEILFDGVPISVDTSTSFPEPQTLAAGIKAKRARKSKSSEDSVEDSTEQSSDVAAASEANKKATESKGLPHLGHMSEADALLLANLAKGDAAKQKGVEQKPPLPGVAAAAGVTTEEAKVEDPNMPCDKTPREIVDELDKHIIGQARAKRAVAISLRNRYRRHRLPAELKNEVMPKNLLMIGPTGVGKTEIARRMAKLTDAPFLKVEATKFTEVGFHGRDVDMIIHDLVQVAIQHVRTRRRKRMKAQIDKAVEETIIKALLGNTSHADPSAFIGLLRGGALETLSIEFEVPVKDTDGPPMGNSGEYVLFNNLKKAFGGQRKTEKKRMPIKDARAIIEEIETERLTSSDDLLREAIKSAENDGIVFIDEIDKIVSSSDRKYYADASSEGVQRDLLPLVEGCTINTKFGNVETDHILFIASGAFHSVKPSDMLPELQGRLPIRVQLDPLTEDDMYKILTQTQNNFVMQQKALLKTENVELDITDDAVREIARVAATANRNIENIGARRLHAVMERIMDDISFQASDMAGQTITITAETVRSKVTDLLRNVDLSKYVL